MGAAWDIQLCGLGHLPWVPPTGPSKLTMQSEGTPGRLGDNRDPEGTGPHAAPLGPGRATLLLTVTCEHCPLLGTQSTQSLQPTLLPAGLSDRASNLPKATQPVRAEGRPNQACPEQRGLGRAWHGAGCPGAPIPLQPCPWRPPASHLRPGQWAWSLDAGRGRRGRGRRRPLPRPGSAASPRSSRSSCCTACGRRAPWPPWTTLWSGMPAPSPSATRWAWRAGWRRWARPPGLRLSPSAGWPASCQVSPA